MRNAKPNLRRVIYVALFLCTVCVSVMGYRQVEQARRDNVHDLSTWLSKRQIVHLMNFHGTDGLKVTQDEVYIYRGDRWIPVMKRPRG
jgi:hypothetical protein